MSNLTDRLVPLARPLATWVAAGAVISFIGAILSLTLGLYQSIVTAAESPSTGVFLFLQNSIMGLASVALGVALMRYAQKLSRMAATRDIVPLIEGAAHERTYWQIAMPLLVAWMALQFLGTAVTAFLNAPALIEVPDALRQLGENQTLTGPVVGLYLLAGAFVVAGMIVVVQASKD